MGRHTIHKVGNIHGGLEIIEIIPQNRAGQHVKLKCLCHYCNNITIINGIFFKKFISCGCQQRISFLWKRKGPKNMPWKLPSGNAAKNNLYIQYKNSARRRKKEFSLLKEDFFELITGKCIYCGDQYTNKIKGQGKTSGDFLYTGIDRIDSSIGYTKENSVSCCWTCNNMKNTMSNDVFIQHINKIHMHTK